MKNNWVIFLVLLGFCFFCLMGWSFYRAGTHGSRVTDKEYTKHGHQYAQTAKEMATSSQLGWKAICEKKGKQLTVQLMQKEGLPVAGAEGRIEFMAPGSGTALSTTEMKEIAAGFYIVDLPPLSGKEVTGNLSFRKGRILLRKRVMILL